MVYIEHSIVNNIHSSQSDNGWTDFWFVHTPPYIIFRRVTHVVIVACNYPSSAYMNVIHLCGSMNSELRTLYVSSVWSYHNQLFTMYHSGYYNPIFDTTIPNILMKCFLRFLCSYRHSILKLYNWWREASWKWWWSWGKIGGVCK